MQTDKSQGFPVPPGDLFEEIQIATDGRVFFVTEDGSMGLGPASVQRHDMIHVLPSGRTHFVLRSRLLGSKPPDANLLEWSRSLKSDHCEMVGDCYLHTNATMDDRRTAEEEPAVGGSLPFELLGVEYLENVLPNRRTVWLF